MSESEALHIDLVSRLTPSVMIAETISLGILALPKALSTLGLLPYAPDLLVLDCAGPRMLTCFTQWRLDHHWGWDHFHVHGVHHRAAKTSLCTDS